MFLGHSCFALKLREGRYIFRLLDGRKANLPSREYSLIIDDLYVQTHVPYRVGTRDEEPEPTVLLRPDTALNFTATSPRGYKLMIHSMSTRANFAAARANFHMVYTGCTHPLRKILKAVNIPRRALSLYARSSTLYGIRARRKEIQTKGVEQKVTVRKVMYK